MTKLEKLVYDAIFGKKKAPRHENELKWGKLSSKPLREDQLILGEGVYSDLWDENSRLRPNNTLVIGGAGSGKNRNYIEPNLLSGNTNYVVVDRDGEIQSKYAKILKEAGFNVKGIDAAFQSEDCVNFNPFVYLEKEVDICGMAEILAKSCYHEHVDPFLLNLSGMVLRTLICYIKDTIPKREQSLFALCKIFDDEICAESNGSAKQSMVENYLTLMKEYCERFPNGFGAVCFHRVCAASSEFSLQTTFMDLAVGLFPWIKAMYNEKHRLAGEDGVDFASFRDKKSVLFLNMSSRDCTYNAYYELCLWQTYKAFMKEEAEGKRTVHFVLNESTSYQIPELGAFLSGGRRCGLLTSIVIQSITQLKSRGENCYDAIVGNYDNLLYLYSSDCATNEFISKLLGQTVVYNKPVPGKKEYIPGRRCLMLPDELGRLPASDCVIIRRGEHPYYTRKFDPIKHPNYREEK